MSWWPLPDDEDNVTGDGPADAVDGALLNLAESRKGKQEQLPTLEELLRAIELALSQQSAKVQDAPAALHISTRLGVNAAPDAPEDLIHAIKEAITGIAASFERDLSRLPRLVEVLYTFTFALGGEPETMLRQPLPRRIDLISR